MNKLNVLFNLALVAGTLLVACVPVPPKPTSTPVPATPTMVSPLPTSSPGSPLPTPSPVSPLPTPSPGSPLPTPTSLVSLIISSSAFEPDAEISEGHGLFRVDVSPELTWDDVPEGTRSLALLMADGDFWAVYNIPPDATGLPAGTLQGLNANQEIGFAGPYLPPDETHRHIFILHALDVPLDLDPGATQEQVLAAMKGHVLATSELIGTFVGITP
jgi:Raf kinase inhibitor-like YbhB/YbcL family protein